MKNNIFKIMATVASVCVAGVMVAFACSKTSLANDVASIVDNIEIQTGVDEFAGVYITAGVEQTNATQEKIKSEGKIYATLNEAEEYVFEGLDGAFSIIKAYVDNEELSYTYGGTDYIASSNTNSYEECAEDGHVVSAKITGEVYLDINAALGKDVYCFINPIYREPGTGKYYVTANGCKTAQGMMSEYAQREQLNLEKAKEMFKTEWNEDPALKAELDPRLYIGATGYQFYVESFKSEDFNANKNTAVTMDIDVALAFEQPVVNIEGSVFNKQNQEIVKYNMTIQELLDGKTLGIEPANVNFLRETVTYGDGTKSRFVDVDGVEQSYYDVYVSYDEDFEQAKAAIGYEYVENPDDMFVKTVNADVIIGKDWTN